MVKDGLMPQRQFANQKALIEYAEQNGLAYAWQGSPSFAKRQRSYRRSNTRLSTCTRRAA